MALININKDELKKILKKDVKEQEIIDSLISLGVKVEKIEGEDISLEINPNRPDMLSVEGVGRALRTFLSISKGLQIPKLKDSGYEVVVDSSVRECRPYTACAIVRDVKLNDEKIKSMIQLQEKLHLTYGRDRKKCAIGIYPLDVIKPPIYFKGLKPEEIKFAPLGYKREMNATQILREHPKGKEYAHLVDGLKRYACFLDSRAHFMSFTPIINSEETGKVDENTRALFIECSGFNYEVVSKCLNIIACAFYEMGCNIESMKLKYPEKVRITPDFTPYKIKIDSKYVEKILGKGFSEKEIEELLKRMGYDVEGNEVVVPPYRVDVLHPIDLIEDIAIAFGYEKFEGSPLKSLMIGEEQNIEKIKSRIRESLIGFGLLEVRNYHLANLEQQKEILKEDGFVLLKNSKSKEYNSLRKSLALTLLNTFARNLHREYPQAIFEIGKVFDEDKDKENGVKEEERLCVAIASENADYTKIRQVLDALLRNLNKSALFEEAEHPLFFKGRCACVKIDKKIIGYVGEIHPAIINRLNIIIPISCFEISLEDF